MSHVIADRVKETSTSTGTGVLALAGAPSGFVTFAAKCAVGDAVYYCVAHQSANEWECGLGKYSAANQLTRVQVFSGSNGTAAVSFSAGTKDVFITVPAVCSTFVREQCSTNKTYYVAKTGNDSNDGLTPGTAFLTVQKAVNVICDTQHVVAGTITISIGPGTYAEAVLLRPISSIGSARVVLDGGGSGVALIPPYSSYVDCNGVNSNYELTGLSIPGIFCRDGAVAHIGEVTFASNSGLCNMAAVGNGACIDVVGPVIATGSALAHLLASYGGVIQCANLLDLSSTPSFGWTFAAADHGGQIFADGMEVTGTATGQRYSVESAGVIVAGINDPLPGDVAGTTATGGAYYT